MAWRDTPLKVPPTVLLIGGFLTSPPFYWPLRDRLLARGAAAVVTANMWTPDWLVASGCTHVAMESTGIYWRPVYQILESRGLEVCLVNAQHVRMFPAGRPTCPTASGFSISILWVCCEPASVLLASSALFALSGDTAAV